MRPHTLSVQPHALVLLPGQRQRTALTTFGGRAGRVRAAALDLPKSSRHTSATASGADLLPATSLPDNGQTAVDPELQMTNNYTALPPAWLRFWINSQPWGATQ